MHMMFLKWKVNNTTSQQGTHLPTEEEKLGLLSAKLGW